MSRSLWFFTITVASLACMLLWLYVPRRGEPSFNWTESFDEWGGFWVGGAIALWLFFAGAVNDFSCRSRYYDDYDRPTVGYPYGRD